MVLVFVGVFDDVRVLVGVGVLDGVGVFDGMGVLVAVLGRGVTVLVAEGVTGFFVAVGVAV